MSGVFLQIFNMSISASYIVLAVLLLRLILRKAPKWIMVFLWGIAALRLVCPFSIESAVSLIPSAEVVSPSIMTDSAPTLNTGIPIINNAVNPIIGGTFTPDPGNSANPLQVWIPILTALWLTGIATLLIYTVISYARVKSRIGTAVICHDNIYQSESVVSPFVLGILKPRIYLPFNISGQDMVHVIAHENAHIRRKDHLWKPLGFLLLTLHWFNPMMWLGYVLLCRDIELACDEKVIRELDRDARADYSEALLTCGVNRRMISACPLAFGEVSVKSRVRSVLNYKKPAFWIIIAAVVACIVVAVCFLTDPPASKDTELGIEPNTQDIFTEYDGVYVTLEHTETNSDGDKVFNVVIHNDTDKQITYGEIYGIERQSGEEWIDTVSEDVAFLTIGILLPPRETASKSYSTHGFDISKPGTYRLAIPFSVEEDGEYVQYRTYLEFDVASISEVGGVIPAQYTQAISDYKQMVSGLFAEDFEQKVNDGYFESPNDDLSYEWFCMVIDAKQGIDHISPDSFGYALCDLDGDNTDELILLREDYFVLAVYTTVEQEAKLIGAYYYKSRGIILEDGSVYNAVNEAANIFVRNVYRLELGKLSLVKAFGSNGENYYELSHNGEKQITAAEFETLNANYPTIRDQSQIKEYMSNNGIAFMPLS